MNASLLIRKLWTFCNVLRDDGMSNADYVEQLTYLLFLKMADERSKPPFLDLTPLPKEHSWSALRSVQGVGQLELYQRALIELGERTDLFGTIYRRAISRFRDPSKFGHLVREIDQLEWSKYDSDVKGDAYEGLLERTAADTKSGAGQYFTPRPLVEAIVDVMRPSIHESVCDPACGTGGFLLAWIAYIRKQVSVAEIPGDAITGFELVDSVARLCLMNLVLHGVGGKRNPVIVDDSLSEASSRQYSVVLANPPFGRKSSVTIVGEEGEAGRESSSVARSDFWATTSNKQLNFLQHIFTILEDTGRAAVVLPDNVLFEGGAGETIRRRLLALTDVHTMLRLPSGIFYAQGVKANVLFFDKKPVSSEPWTKRLWIYDLRTNNRFTLKEKPLKSSDLTDFVQCFNPNNRLRRTETDRFRSYSFEELLKRDRVNLDIIELTDRSLEDSADLPKPSVLTAEIIEDLEAALAQFALIASDFPTR